MNSHEKNNDIKKYMFKEGSNPLFPISNKTPNPSKNYSASKSNVKLDLKNQNKKLALNCIDSNFNNKKNKIEPSIIKNYKELNKTYSSSKPKEGITNINNLKFSKIKPIDISNIKDNKIFENYKFIKNQKNVNENKEKNNINGNNIKVYTNNLNINSLKNYNVTNINKNKNNNSYSLRKPNVNKNILERNNSNINSYYSNIILNNNSSTNIYNKNTNLQIINDRILKTPKESNVKLIFYNKNIFEKKIEDPPIILKRKDSSLPLKYINAETNLRISTDKIIFNGEYKLHLKKSKKNFSKNNIYINMKNVDEDIIIEDFQKKKKQIKGQEDLHFYYVDLIQNGKKKELLFDKD